MNELVILRGLWHGKDCCGRTGDAARWLPRLCAVAVIAVLTHLQAMAYNVFTPAEGATLSSAFNIVVRDGDEPSRMPATLEISAHDDFSTVDFRTSSWRSDSQWWVASVPAGALSAGQNYWRIADAADEVHAFVCAGELAAAGGELGRDPGCHIVTAENGKLYTLTNMWVRNDRYGNSLGEYYAFPGRAAAGLAVSGDNLIIPVFRTDYKGEPQTFGVYDRITGKSAGTATISQLGNFASHIWNKRRFEEAGNDDAGNCWIGSAFNVCDNATSTGTASTTTYDYYKDVLASGQYLLVETVDFTDIENPQVKRRIRLNLPASLTSDDRRKYIVSGIHVRGNLDGADFAIYAGAYIYSTDISSAIPLTLIKWEPAAADAEKTTVTIAECEVYESDRLMGQNAQVFFTDDSHFVLNSTDHSHLTSTAAQIRVAHPTVCELGYRNDTPIVTPTSVLAIDAATIESLQAESLQMRQDGGAPAQRPQTGSALHGFTADGNTFVVHTYTMQPRLQFAIRTLADATAIAANDATPPDGTGSTTVLFPDTPWKNIFMSVRPVGIGAIRTAADKNGTDLYMYMPPATLARYRLSPVISTNATDITEVSPDARITRNGDTLTLTGTHAPLSIINSNGITVLRTSADSTHNSVTLNIARLPAGIYIATSPAAKPLKFSIS